MIHLDLIIEEIGLYFNDIILPPAARGTLFEKTVPLDP